MENQIIIFLDKTFYINISNDQKQNLYSGDDLSEKTENSLSKKNSDQQKIVIHRKQIQKKKQSLKHKQFEYKAVSNLCSIYDVESLFLLEEVFIVLDFNDQQLKNASISCQNNFKRFAKQLSLNRVDFQKLIWSKKFLLPNTFTILPQNYQIILNKKYMNQVSC
ncbi:hypothetical protein ABPG72_008928 [Tetrahymena utriculariae]